MINYGHLFFVIYHKRFCYKSVVCQNFLWLIAERMAPVSWLMSLLWCLLYLSFVSCLLYLVSCLLLPRILSHVSCLRYPVSRLLSQVSCLKSPVSRLLSHTSCPTSPVSRLLSHVSCPTSPVSFLLSHVWCHMSPVLRVVSFLYKQSLSELVAQLVELRELMPEVWMVFIYPKCVRNTKIVRNYCLKMCYKWQKRP